MNKYFYSVAALAVIFALPVQAGEWVVKVGPQQNNPNNIFNVGYTNYISHTTTTAEDLRLHAITFKPLKLLDPFFGLKLEEIEAEAEKGGVEAQNHLGILYAEGRGVTQNYAVARQWWEKAAAQGHANAKEWLQKLKAMGY